MSALDLFGTLEDVGSLQLLDQLVVSNGNNSICGVKVLFLAEVSEMSSPPFGTLEGSRCDLQFEYWYLFIVSDHVRHFNGLQLVFSFLLRKVETLTNTLPTVSKTSA